MYSTIQYLPTYKNYMLRRLGQKVSGLSGDPCTVLIGGAVAKMGDRKDERYGKMGGPRICISKSK